MFVKRHRLVSISSIAAASILLLYANWGGVTLPQNLTVDQVVIEKANRRLLVLLNGKLIRSYPISLGRSPLGPKAREGDNKTPEGDYVIDWRNPKSGYHLSMHVSYPSDLDLARAKAGGYSPGGAIMIHGIRNGFGWIGRLHRSVDWTRGCIAVTNDEMDELWRIVPDRTPIRIEP